MALRITTLAERPELVGAMWAMENSWPEFMFHDPMAALFYDVCAEAYPEFVLVADDDADPGTPVAKAFSVPFTWTRDELPDGGWDSAILWAWDARQTGVKADRVTALEITVRTDLLGTGLSPVMLGALRDNAARLGFTELLAPVRPNAKHLEPRTPMAEYAFRTRPDGLPADPWLRVHVRAGGTIVKVAPRSMTISGTLAEWREWTGLPFDTSGRVEVPKGLCPVHVDVEQDHAVYVEPNVWVRHPLS
ncbi:N-acetyltransferase [Planomonospora sp. ID67723]|uniref:N-acetyltransferase n=1 Tax=Planomonospora sp. ID67723 TaxID=2738134 RepID=UPI0018C393F6|nr:N-acetyltransferase [Planomonospora sp. ID67723]MBG0827844.1 N-acetyltransferase [Planomonospora sp. ID67723]